MFEVDNNNCIIVSEIINGIKISKVMAYNDSFTNEELVEIVNEMNKEEKNVLHQSDNQAQKNC